jgi:hypothetical protein
MADDPHTPAHLAARPSPRFARLGRKEIGLLAGVGLAIVGVVVGLVVSGSSPAKKLVRPTVVHATTTTTKPITARCPLTDTPPPGGDVPDRPALLVKIGNEPDGARPQSGLNEADIIFDTPAEGFIMRYVAVYQCQNASMIGPDRSVRWVDWNMVARQFVSPILAFAGGINPNVDGLEALPWLSGANLLEGAQSAGVRTSSRVPPDNLYTSTAALYGLFKTKTTPPSPIFDYSAAPPPGSRPAAALGINFSGGTDVVWKWDDKSGLWLHTYSGAPDIDVLTNQQVSTTNIVVEIVHYTIGPYIESTGGTGDVESQLLGSGPGYVLRGGRIVPVTWHRAGELSKSTFTNAAGQAVELAPGRTWVEIVPDTQADAPGGITITP